MVSEGSDQAEGGGATPPRPEEPTSVDPRLLSEIGNLAFRARIIADSVLHGMHRSRHHGTSVEFAEHKEYSPGDDIRHLDWRAFARFDRDYIKRFEDEAHLRALLVLDTSGSMGYRGIEGARDPRETKLEYGKTLAAALAYALARQGDGVGLASFGTELELLVPTRARRGHLQEVFSHLESLAPDGPTRLEASINALAEGMTRRMIVVVISDLLDSGEAAMGSLARLAARRHDVVLFHVLDPDELDFPFEDSTLFASIEDEREVQIDARAIREAYLQEIGAFLARVESRARSAGIEYHRVRTSDAPGRFLVRFLAGRASRRASAR